MANILDLIKKLCPNGVEYKKLGEVCEHIRPDKYISTVDIKIDEKNSVPVLTPGKTFILGFSLKNNGFYPGLKDNVILFDDFTTSFK